MKEGNNYDAVFAEIAESVLKDRTTKHPRACFLHRIRKAVIEPLRRRGTSVGVLANLELQAREAFNAKSSPLLQFSESPKSKQTLPRPKQKTIRYDDGNTVPRINGARK